MSFLKDAFGTVTDKVSSAKHSVVETVDEAEAKIQKEGGVINAIESKAGSLRNEVKMEIGRLIAAKLSEAFTFAMDTVCVHLKEKLTDDKYMPEVVKGMIRTLVDGIWPDVKGEVKDAIFDIVDDDDDDFHHGEPPCFRYTPIKIIRYSLYPYDRNIWRKIRDPLWWLLNLISLVPYYGITQIYHILLFLCIDKHDEFQLLEYIATFKSLMFISLGCIGCMVGSIQYYICTSKVPSDCQENSPKEQIFTIGLFVAQIIVTWTAFMLTFVAEQNGGHYVTMTEESEDRIHEKNDGKEKEPVKDILMGDVIESAAFEPNPELDERCKKRFLILLIYDFILFLVCAGLALWAAFANSLDSDSKVQENEASYTERNWKFASTLFWIKSFYGLMSFPFVILRIPILKSLFAHVKPTGYNPWGRCVRYLGYEEKSVPWREPEEEQLDNEPAKDDA